MSPVGAADLGDDHVGLGALGQIVDVALDLVGDMGDDLHGLPQVGALALLVQHVPVDLAGGQVGIFVQVFVDEPFIVAQVQVGLGAVVGDEHLAVLQRAHRAGVHVDVRVQLLAGHLQPAGLEQTAQAGRRDALPQPGDHAPGHKDILRCHRNPSHVYAQKNKYIIHFTLLPGKLQGRKKAGEKRRGILTKPPRACTILLSYKTGMDSAGRTVTSAQAGRNPHLSAVRADLMFAQAQQ